MRSQVRDSILAGLCVALCAAPALAGQPTAEGSFVSPHLHLLSTVLGGGPYLGCCAYAPTAFKVTVGGGTALPAGEHVEIRFIRCNGWTACSSTPLPAGSAVDCVLDEIDTDSGPTGTREFFIQGGGVGLPGPAEHCVEVWAGSPAANLVLIGTASITSLEMNGDRHFGAGDLSIWLGLFGSTGGLSTAGDLDGSGTMGANDLSIWLQIFGTGPPNTSCDPC